MKTILTAVATAALIATLAPATITAAHADGITLKRSASTAGRTSRNRTGTEPDEQAQEEPADDNETGADEIADNEDGGWSWGGGRDEEDDEPNARDERKRETIVLSRDNSRHRRHWWHRHGERKRTIWILNWW